MITKKKNLRIPAKVSIVHACFMQLDSAYMVAVFFSIFRLSGDVSIQMVTALVLQLIQCSVKIPEKPDEMQAVPSVEDGEEDNKPVSIVF